MCQEGSSVTNLARELERGRESYGQHAWADAYKSLSFVDDIAPLDAEDLERLAMSAYLIAQDDDYLRILDRAYQARVEAGECSRGARCAFWLGLRLLFRGETGRATGWFSRARRLLEGQQQSCVEEGYLLLPTVEQELDSGDCDAAYAIAGEAAEIGGRFGEPDLIAIARHLQGRALVQQGHVERGLALLDEAMLAVTAGELSPLVTGLIYCSVIDGCHQVYAMGRAREWTAALARWCETQPELVSFTGKCLVHRAEIMQFQGDWSNAIVEARRGCARFERRIDPHRPAGAYYQLAELHRLRGEFAAADEAYRSASRWGWEPQPGLALLRMAQGRVEIAVRAIRRVVSATKAPLDRAKFLPAYVEIMLEAGEIEDARSACLELQEIAARFDTSVIDALAAHALGAVKLADGDAQAALGSLHRALQVWQQVDAPHMIARERLLMGLACRILADEEGATLELDAAREVFEQLEAAPDLARVESLTKGGAPACRPHGLTPRELQVLRLIATGKTNKGIAAELFLSGRTIDRHVSNIFTKLDLPSRAAATAYAYKHKLISTI